MLEPPLVNEQPADGESAMPKKIDRNKVQTKTGTGYPAPYHEPCVARVRQRLADAAGLTQFGVSLTRLPAGAWSSQRHWHGSEDEFVYVLEGELTLVTDGGEEVLKAGDSAGFKAGDPDGHHLQNRTAKDAVYLDIGSRRADDEVIYPNIDLKYSGRRDCFTHANGEPYV
jgi:uncharacterized cupin superfamily protein